MGYGKKTKPAPRAATGRFKKVMLWAGGILLVLLALGAFGYKRAFHGYAPKELMRDIKAGVAAREIKDPDQRFEKYLENRYGSLADPANRQRAFLSFFDPEHIRALQFLATHAPQAQRPENIAATAHWVEKYRDHLTVAERAALGAQLNSDAGKQMLRKATSIYNSQDIYYRGNTAPVISQLLKTIHEVQSAGN